MTPETTSNADGSQPRKQVILLLLRIVVIVTILAGLAVWVDLPSLLNLIYATPVWLVLTGFFLGLVRIFVMSVRWYWLNRHLAEPAVDGSNNTLPTHLSLKRCWEFKLASSSLNLVLPSAFGSDVGRMVMVARERESDRLDHIMVVVLDRMLGLFTLGLIGLLAGILASDLEYRERYLIVVSTFLLALLAPVAVFPTRWGHAMIVMISNKLGRAGQKILAVFETWMKCSQRLKGKWHIVPIAIGLSAVAHAVSFLLVILSAREYGAEVSAWTLTLVTAISWLVTLIPIGLGGLGLRELSFAVQLTPQGVDPSKTLAISLFQFAVQVMVGIAGLPWLLASRSDRKPESIES